MEKFYLLLPKAMLELIKQNLYFQFYKSFISK